MQTDRMIVPDRHDTAVSQEFAVDGLDQPAAIAVAFVRLQVAIKLRVAVTTIQRPAEIPHYDGISVERGKVVAVGVLPSSKA